jgi:hypothetical protein
MRKSAKDQTSFQDARHRVLFEQLSSQAGNAESSRDRTDSSRAIGKHCTQITDFLFRRSFSIRNPTRVRVSAPG